MTPAMRARLGLGYHDPIYDAPTDTPDGVQTMGAAPQQNSTVPIVIIAVIVFLILNSED